MVSSQKMDLKAPLREGEFRRIKGIAEPTELALHEAGIMTFDQLASLTPKDISEALPGHIGVMERATRQNWIGQAGEFARALTETNLAFEVEEPGERLHYESIMIKLLVDDEHNVHSTQATHIKGETKDWPGWEPDELLSWITKHADIIVEHPASQRTLTHTIYPTKVTGNLHIQGIRVIGPATEQPKKTLRIGAPFKVRLDLDFNEVDIPPQSVLRYRATVSVRKLSSWEQVHLGQFDGEIQTDDPSIITGLLPGLLEGSYHLDAAIVVSPVGSTQPDQDELHVMTEGVLVRVLQNEPEPA